MQNLRGVETIFLVGELSLEDQNEEEHNEKFRTEIREKKEKNLKKLRVCFTLPIPRGGPETIA